MSPHCDPGIIVAMETNTERQDATAKPEGVEARSFVGQGTAATLTIKTYPATVSVTHALDAAGVDGTELEAAMLRLSRHDLKALEDRSLLPSELGLPLPSGLAPERLPGLAASYATSILSDWDRRWTRGVTVVTLSLAALGFLWKIFGSSGSS